MGVHTRILLSFLSVSILHAHTTICSTTGNVDASRLDTYVVRVRPPPNFSIDMSNIQLESWYRSFLPPRMASSNSQQAFIYTYKTAIFGFTVKLTEAEKEFVMKKNGVLEVYKDNLLPLLTTHTPDFLGLRLSEGSWKKTGMGEGVIIGILDTGIDSRHISFDDDGMQEPPAKWRGSCESSQMKCNKKLIGASSFKGGHKSLPPMDDSGHGTHTASTAAGSFVDGASVFGNGNGTAAGMAPRAHLAIYKVCSRKSCAESDILAGMEAAIADGVDIMSLSLGGPPKPFYSDVIAIASFSATRKGIFVSLAAGNSGPFSSTLSNEEPWVLSVGASTMDRQMEAIVKLGDGHLFVGESAYQPYNIGSLQLVYPPFEPFHINCLFVKDVAGKIVACEHTHSASLIGRIVKDAGGSGLILLGQEGSGHTTFAELSVLPVSYVDSPDAVAIREYFNSSNNPTASIIYNGTSLGNTQAPVVAFFSSRGPSTVSPGILKPDIIGPGVNVIAAWPFMEGKEADDAKHRTFNCLSGTSMSTPHLSGIAALIRATHPDWSPAAIKSAIMTTAYVVDNQNKPILDEKFNTAGHFAIGAGHVNPFEAIDPGLIYDTDEAQYISYLCGLGYTDAQVEIITHQKDSCQNGTKITEAELNYPSVAVRASAGKLVVNRTVTNVGEANSSYTVEIDMPREVKASVSPTKLEFTKMNEKKIFSLSLSWDIEKTNHAEGSFKWVSEKHVVRSPIAIF
ncbi:subtilisin-like protease 3 [Oryza brachyantha]|uniref:Subtilisin-like protease n=1 Tax=Oryza brachyantha TaxID=4533 RepID=J3ND31_ORYBR|nr:subtilisin-like protease 3 [Oryza brachyantha]